MSKARNEAIAGAYQGKLVGNIGGTPCIFLKLTETLILDKTTVSKLELIDETSDISVASAATRGLIGEILFGPIGLAAAGTAARNEKYILGIEFKDSKRCVVKVDNKIYKNIVKSCI